MLRLPLLIRILPVGPFEKEMIICRRFFNILQMIVGRGSQEISDRDFLKEFRACVERFDRQSVIFVFVGRKSQIAVSRSHFGLEFDGSQEFLFGIVIFLLDQQGFSEFMV